MPAENRIAITGVTGFVGRALPRLLAEKGFAVTGISRSGGGDVPGVDRWQTPDALDFSGYHAVIHLAGEPVAQRWTEETKQRLRESRVDYTHDVVAAIRRLPETERPAVLVNASAVGFYGDRGDEILAEDAAPGSGYLADLCREWEAAADEAEPLGVRVVKVRIGIVLGRGGEAFEKLHGVFKFGIGGKLGNGRQWMPWIHVDDLRAAIVHAVISRSLSGPVNGTAPEPERNSDFTKKFAAAMHRPALFTVPEFALKIVFGEFAGSLFHSNRVIPSALVADGFRFRFETLEDALGDLLEKG